MTRYTIIGKVKNTFFQVGYAIKQRLAHSKIILTGLLPRGLKTSRFRNDAYSVNNYLGDMLKPGDNLLYLKPSGWTLPNGDRESDLYFKDGHHFSIYISNIVSFKLYFSILSFFFSSLACTYNISSHSCTRHCSSGDCNDF